MLFQQLGFLFDVFQSTLVFHSLYNNTKNCKIIDEKIYTGYWEVFGF